jgi:outer membrane protein assembly factor BamB
MIVPKRMPACVLAVVGFLVIAIAGVPVRASAQSAIAASDGGARGFQITADHAGAIEMPGVTPPLRIRWATTLAPHLSYPVVAHGMVFVVGLGNTSTLYALNARTGRIVWQRRAPSGYGPWIGAAYDEGVVFVVPESGATPGGPGAMFAYSARDGMPLWRAVLPGQYLFTSAPTARNGYVYTGGAGSGGTVYAVRETDGALVWTAPVENGDSSAPAVTADGVFVSYVCPQTYRFAPAAGTQIWQHSGGCEGGGGESAAVYAGSVWVRDVYDFQTDGIVLDAASGKLTGGFNSTYAPAFRSGTGFFTEPGTLTATVLATGKALWSVAAPTGSTFSCAPIVVNDTVYVPSTSGALYGFAGDTGRLAFKMLLPSPVLCSEYFAVPLLGLGAGDGLVVVPSGNVLVALQ